MVVGRCLRRAGSVRGTNINLKTGTRNTTIPDRLLHWRAQPRLRGLVVFTGPARRRHVQQSSDYNAVARVAPGYFEVFGATARTGRLFTREEQQPGGADAVVISEAYWRRQFASDPRAIGSTITFGQRTRTIIGVTPLRYPARTDIYYPDPVAPESQSRTAHNYRGVGRLAAGVSVVQAQSEMTASRLGSSSSILSATRHGLAVVPVKTSCRRHASDAVRAPRRGRVVCDSRARTSPTCCSRAPRLAPRVWWFAASARPRAIDPPDADERVGCRCWPARRVIIARGLSALRRSRPKIFRASVK